MKFHCVAVVNFCSKKGENNVRIYDKRHSCLCCDKNCAKLSSNEISLQWSIHIINSVDETNLFAKIAQHYEHYHGCKAKVAEVFAYQQGSRDHGKALKKPILRGHFFP